jgi:hypothetical protein
MRRGLGFKLHDAGIGLLDFVAVMERKHAPRITTKLALEQPVDRADYVGWPGRSCGKSFSSSDIYRHRQSYST